MRKAIRRKKRLSLVIAVLLLGSLFSNPALAADMDSFTDVSRDAYYFQAVAWAADRGITKGTSETTFSPNEYCTRAQIVTLLYRFDGEPIVESSIPFTDVQPTDYYYGAIQWAYGIGVTTGTSETEFSPDDPCTRAQVVAFLHRHKGSPDYTATDKFLDVSSDAYYAQAVAWAESDNITLGTSETTFSPDEHCTRAQIVTFLYRYAESLGYDTSVTPQPEPDMPYTEVSSAEIASEVPSYLVDNTVRVINAVNQDLTQPGTDAFLYFTDPHVWFNTWSSADVMGSLFEHTGIKKLICGGDIATSYERNQSECIASFTDNYWTHISAILPPDARHYMVRGNHDYYWTNPYTDRYEYLSDTDVHYYVMQAGSNQESYVNSVEGKNYYTFSNDTAKIEYIVLSTVLGKGSYNIDGAQIDWLIDQLADVPAGYSTLVIGHIPVSAAMASYDESANNLDVVQEVLEAYANKKSTTIQIWDMLGYSHDRPVDYSWSQSNLIGYLAGHEHGDCFLSQNGVNYINVCADAPYTDVFVGTKLERTVGTQSECAVDACIINTEDRTMTLYRIGAGEDLVFSY